MYFPIYFHHYYSSCAVTNVELPMFCAIFTTLSIIFALFAFLGIIINMYRLDKNKDTDKVDTFIFVTGITSVIGLIISVLTLFFNV